MQALQISNPEEREQLIRVLSTSLYVGAKDESIGLVLDYCRAANLDPMQKPVHIVPMNTRDPVTGKYEWRDVVMPGVGLYRIQADRSNTMAGISAPTFGDDVTKDFTDKNDNTVTVTYPEWCEITIQKIVADRVVEFTAREYWIENYATDSNSSTAPNKMWRKRPRGQLAKCTEAQVLRKGWPEIGQAPTAEEMEGKIIEGEVVSSDPEPTPTARAVYTQKQLDENWPEWMAALDQGKANVEFIINKVESKYILPDELRKKIEDLPEELKQAKQQEIDDANK